ncbi:MAG: hypothetical protein ACREI7_05430, partial [Myxococcota bacterium]
MTSPPPEAVLAAPQPRVMRAPPPETNAVMQHLLVAHAYADHDPQRLAEYYEMIERDVAAFANDFDRAIALAFHLVLDEKLDPWHLDLVQFAGLYADRVKKTHEVDLLTAGRLIAMAWTILRRQSEALLVRATPPPPAEPAWDMPWEAVQDSWGTSDEATLFTQRVLSAPRAPLIESVFHQGNRRVTLMELVEALEDARHEAEIRLRLAQEREKAREQMAGEGDALVRRKVHKEDLESEIADVRQRLAKVDG